MNLFLVNPLLSPEEAPPSKLPVAQVKSLMRHIRADAAKHAPLLSDLAQDRDASESRPKIRIKDTTRLLPLYSTNDTNMLSFYAKAAL